MTRKYKTTSHIILYFDVLGYQEIISNNKKDENSFIRAIMQIIEEIGSIKNAHITEKIKPVIRCFSDNFVICLKETESVETWEILTYFILIIEQIQMLSILDEDLFLRGSIVRGDIFVNSNFLYGEGLIKAYKYEDSIAIYPRIIIEKSLMEDVFGELKRYNKDVNINNLFEILCDPIQEKESINNNSLITFLTAQHISVGDDGQYFINYLQQFKRWASYEESTPKYISDLIIRYGIKLYVKLKTYNKNIAVYNKYYWCYTQLLLFINESLEKWGFIPKKELLFLRHSLDLETMSMIDELRNMGTEMVVEQDEETN